ncbi:hypothetical protein HJC23_003214, partial [Cyclotella cryptica]
ASATMRSTSHQHRLPPPAKDDINFQSLPWNLNLPDQHYYLHLVTTPMEGWTNLHYDPTTDGGVLTSKRTDGTLESLHHYSQNPIRLTPATTSLNYGTTIWEGLACRRSPTSEKALVFRPQKNYARFVQGAHAMCLPPPSYELFMRGLQLVVQNNIHLLPPSPDIDPKTGVPLGGAKLYVRPMLMGSGQQLGLHSSPQVSLVYFVSPTGSYFQGNAMGGLKLHLERRKSRAARGGLGSVKCCGNYAVTMRPLLDAKKLGFDDNLYLDLDTYRESSLQEAILQELSAANIFLVLKTGEIVTPSLKRGTILPGVTRDSVLELAKAFTDELQPVVAKSVGVSSSDIAVTVSERDVRVKDLLDAVEVFITGTAAEIVPVQSIATSPSPKDELDGGEEESLSVTFPHGQSLPGGPVTTKLLEMLREVMAEKRVCDATKDWLCDLYESPAVFRKSNMK